MILRTRMTIGLIGLIAVSLLPALSALSQSSNDLSVPRPIIPITYTANVGQFDEAVSFQAVTGDVTLYFHPDGVTHVFLQDSPQPPEPYDIPFADEIDLLDRNFMHPPKKELTATRTIFVGADPEARIVGLDLQPHFKNYFLGNDPNRWRTHVPTYRAILYQDIYPKIDLKYYSESNHVKYDYIVNPGGDLSQIRIVYEGFRDIQLTGEGKLRFTNRAGYVEEGFPIIYQVLDGRRVEVSGRYEVSESGAFGFSVESSFDASYPLVIDPLLTHTSYLGGSLQDWGYRVTVGKGLIPWLYVTGHTWSYDFPTDGIYGPYQGTLDGDFDVFLSIYDPLGTVLLSSTYLGGNLDDWGYGLDVDAGDTVYLTGTTSSSNFPLANAYDGSLGGTFDGFVAKLADTGQTLVYSTYLGGDSYDVCNDLVVDPASNNVLVTGMSYSDDFPTTTGAFQEEKAGYWDAFLARLGNTGNLDAATFLGGSGIETSYGIDIQGGEVYITGWTWSTDFPVSVGAAQMTLSGAQDAFVAKLPTSLDQIDYCTYLGGSLEDYGKDIATDIHGSAYVTGWTASDDFPVLGGWDMTFNGAVDAFAVKLASNGSSFLYGSYLGDSDRDAGYGIAVDDSLRVYLSGRTESINFPTTGPFSMPHTPNNLSDAFFARFNSSGNALLFSTCLGDTTSGARAADDWGYDIALWEMPILPVQLAYLTGKTESDELPNSFFTGFSGNYDAFLAMYVAVDIEFPSSVIDSVSPDSAQAGTEINFGGHATHDTLPDLLDMVAYRWNSDIDGQLSDLAEFTSDSLSVGEHQISLWVQNALYIWSPRSTVTVIITDTLLPPEAVIDSIKPVLSVVGENVVFGGHGDDPPENNIIAYRWSSSLDGVLSLSQNFSSTGLVEGVHTISFEVKDNDNNWSTPVTTDIYVQESEDEQWEISWWYPTYNDGSWDLLMYDRYRCTLFVSNLSQFDQEFNLRINDTWVPLEGDNDVATSYSHNLSYSNLFWNVNPMGATLSNWGDSLAEVIPAGKTQRYIFQTADDWDWIEPKGFGDFVNTMISIAIKWYFAIPLEIWSFNSRYQALRQAPMQIVHTYLLGLDAANAAPNKQDTVAIRPYKLATYLISHNFYFMGTVSTLIATYLGTQVPWGPPIAPYFYIAEAYLYMAAFALYQIAYDPDVNYDVYVHPTRPVNVPGYSVVDSAGPGCYQPLAYEAVELYSFADASLNTYGKCVGALQDGNTEWAARQLAASLAYMDKTNDAVAQMNELSAGVTANLPAPSESDVDDIKQNLIDSGMNAFEIDILDAFGQADVAGDLVDSFYARYDGPDWQAFSSMYVDVQDSVYAYMTAFENLLRDLHSIEMNQAIIGKVVDVDPEVIVANNPTAVTAWIEFPGLLFPLADYSFDSMTSANDNSATPVPATFVAFEDSNNDSIPEVRITFPATLTTVGYRLESIYGRVVAPTNDSAAFDTLHFSAAAIVRVVQSQTNPALKGCVYRADPFDGLVPYEDVAVRVCAAADTLCTIGLYYDTSDADGKYVFPSIQANTYYVGYSVPGPLIPKISNNPGSMQSVGCVGVNHQYVVYTPADTVYGPVVAESNDTVNICLVVPDATDSTTWFDQIVGPGSLDSLTGEWSYQPNSSDVGQPITVGVVACNQHGCSDPEFFELEVLESEPVFVEQCDIADTVLLGSTLQHSFAAYSCEELFYDIVFWEPVPTGVYWINPATGMLDFTPDPPDVSSTFTVIVRASDGSLEGFCDLDIYVAAGGCCVGSTGDIDDSGGIDVADLTYLVDYLFRGGPAPVCPEEADVDGSGGTDVADLTYLVDYLFRGGPPPVACG